MAILSVLLTAIIIIVSILIVLIVLVQRPKQEGLGAAFGGGAFDSALGAHTTDVLQKITTYFAVIFFFSAIGLAMVKSRQFAASPANNVLENVDNRDATGPGMPAGISNIPGLETEIIPPVDEGGDKKESTDPEAKAPGGTETPAPKGEDTTPAPEGSDNSAPKGTDDTPASKGTGETPKGAGTEKGKGGE